MTQNIQLHDKHQEATLHYHKDGLIDIFVGLGTLLAGAGMLVDMPWLVAIFPISMMALWKWLKNSITAPRVGEDDPDLLDPSGIKRTRALISGFLIFLIGSALLAFMALFLGNVSPVLKAWLREYIEIGFGIFIAAVISMTALIMKIQRFHIYALLTLLVFAASYFLRIGLPISMILTGSAITLGGLVVLWQFMNNHPLRNA